jgi:RNA polymerase sigma factor (sigma-70 family)
MSAAPLEARSATPHTESLHDRYGAAVLAYCSRRLRSREEAEDATQIVFLNAYRRLAEGVVPQSDPAWLFTIARNVVLHRGRMLARRARVEFPADLDGVHAAAPAVSETAPELYGLAEALAGLTERQRRAIVLREWAGLSYREIAAELDLSISAVEALIFRARRSLAERVEAKGRRRKSALALWLPGGVKSLLGGAAVKVATGAASVAVIVAAAGPIASDRAPASKTRATVLGGAEAIVSSVRKSSRPLAVALRPATHRAPVRRRSKPATVTPNAPPSAGWTASAGETDPPAALPEPADSAVSPAPIPDDSRTPQAAPQQSGEDLVAPTSTPPKSGPPAHPGPPPGPAGSEGAGPPATPPGDSGASKGPKEPAPTPPEQAEAPASPLPTAAP